MEITPSQLCDDLIALIGRAKAGVIALADSHHLTSIQVFALLAIVRGEATMGGLARALHCDASNVTGIVDRLVAQGLAERHESEHDRRAKTLRLTADGHNAVAAILAKLPAHMGCTTLNEAERQALHGIIVKLTA